jgi:hypothetical protein
MGCHFRPSRREGVLILCRKVLRFRTQRDARLGIQLNVDHFGHSIPKVESVCL